VASGEAVHACSSMPDDAELCLVSSFARSMLLSEPFDNRVDDQAGIVVKVTLRKI
jgi:hypothetical protein